MADDVTQPNTPDQPVGPTLADNGQRGNPATAPAPSAGQLFQSPTGNSYVMVTDPSQIAALQANGWQDNTRNAAAVQAGSYQVSMPDLSAGQPQQAPQNWAPNDPGASATPQNVVQAPTVQGTSVQNPALQNQTRSTGAAQGYSDQSIWHMLGNPGMPPAGWMPPAAWNRQGVPNGFNPIPYGQGVGNAQRAAPAQATAVAQRPAGYQMPMASPYGYGSPYPQQAYGGYQMPMYGQQSSPYGGGYGNPAMAQTLASGQYGGSSLSQFLSAYMSGGAGGLQQQGYQMPQQQSMYAPQAQTMGGYQFPQYQQPNFASYYQAPQQPQFNNPYMTAAGGLPANYQQARMQYPQTTPYTAPPLDYLNNGGQGRVGAPPVTAPPIAPTAAPPTAPVTGGTSAPPSPTSGNPNDPNNLQGAYGDLVAQYNATPWAQSMGFQRWAQWQQGQNAVNAWNQNAAAGWTLPGPSGSIPGYTAGAPARPVQGYAGGTANGGLYGDMRANPSMYGGSLQGNYGNVGMGTGLNNAAAYQPYGSSNPYYSAPTQMYTGGYAPGYQNPYANPSNTAAGVVGPSQGA